jgi:hypothetical protein
MAINISCPKCGCVVYAPEKVAGKTKLCPGCGQSISIPLDCSALSEKPETLNCPQCNSTLRLVRQFHGRKVKCNKCGVVLAVSAYPWQLSVVDSAPLSLTGAGPTDAEYLLPSDASESSAQRPTPSSANTTGSLPAFMPPLSPVGDGFSTGATPSPSSSPIIPSLPEGNSGLTKDETDALLARYQSQMKPLGEEIREGIVRGKEKDFFGAKKGSLLPPATSDKSDASETPFDFLNAAPSPATARHESQPGAGVAPQCLEWNRRSGQSTMSPPIGPQPMSTQGTCDAIRCPNCDSTQFFGKQKISGLGWTLIWIGGLGTLFSVILMSVFIGFCTIFLTLPMLIVGFFMRKYVNVCARCRREF